jgi:hypothetical protein
MRRPARLALLAAAALALSPSTRAQSVPDAPRASVAPAFSGRYRLVLTLSHGCPATMQVGPLTVAMTVSEAASGSATEVSGQSAAASEIPADGRFVLLRRGDTVHGAFGSSSLNLGLVTNEGFLLWVRLMLDGTAATSSGGRTQASGTAFGEVDLGQASNPSADSQFCGGVLDHQWSLEPI